MRLLHKKRIWLFAALGIGLAYAILLTQAGLRHGAGGMVSPLDDAYIYYQYAFSAGKGPAFHYQPGAPASSGVTSILYLYILSALQGLAPSMASLAWALGCASLAASLLGLRSLGALWLGSETAWLLPALALACGPYVAAHFNGLETGLFLALLIHAMASRAQAQAGPGFWALILGLAWCRPEGQIMAAFLAWPGRGRRLSSWSLYGLAVLGPSLFWLGLSGSIMPDSVRAKSEGLLGGSLAQRLGRSLGFGWEMLRGLWLNLGGKVGLAGDAASGNPPYLHFMPLTLLLALSGWGKSLNKPGFKIILLSWAMLWAALLWNLPVGWHQHRYTLSLAPLIITGVAIWLHETRPRKPVLAALLLGAWFCFGLASHVLTARVVLAQAENYQAAHGRMGRWLAQHQESGARLAVVDAGILAYESGWAITDLAGITDHAIAQMARQGRGAVMEHLMALPSEERPTHAALWPRPDYDPRPLVRLGVLLPFENAPSGLYSWNWSAIQRQGLHFHGLRNMSQILAQLNVGHIASERSGGPGSYSHQGAPGTLFGRFIAMKDSPLEGGRMATRESWRWGFDAPKQARLFGRIRLAQPARIWARAGNTVQGLDLPSSRVGFYTEFSLPIEAGSSKVDIEAFKPGTREPIEYASFHWWLVQNPDSK